MRLKFVTYTMASGGAERVISILANHFADKYQTEVICLKHGSMFYKLSPSVKVVFADEMAHSWVGRMQWLRKYVGKDDVIIPFMVKIYCVVLLSLIGKRVTIIASERNDPLATSQPWKLLRRLLIRKVTKLVVQTNTIRNYFPAKIQKKICIINNPVDSKQCSPTAWNPLSKTVLAIGRTDDQKNYPMMIQAFHRFHKEYPDFKLEIWGSRRPDKDTKLHELIRKLDAKSYISIYGKSEHVPLLYAKAYMFVMSSNYEGMSNSLIEALCSGLPVISTKVSGANDLIWSGKNGILVDIGDENGLYSAMKELAENKVWTQSMAENAQRLRSLFDVDSICKEWETIIKEAVLQNVVS